LFERVLKFTGTYSEALGLEPYQRYRNILGWVQCHQSSQGLMARVFPSDESGGHEVEPLPDRPALLREGITFDDTGRTLQWGTPLRQLAEIEAPAINWYSEAIFLCWVGRTCLGGLSCDVETGRWFGAPEPRRYHQYLGEFHGRQGRLHRRT
jgi:hypothetical protein